MSTGPRQQGNVAERRHSVMRHYLSGRPMHVIARQLEISTSTVHADIKVLTADWQAAAAGDTAAHVAKELAKADHLEAEHWRAWEASKLQKQRTRTRRASRKAKEDADEGVTTEATVETIQGDGDPRFLQGVAWCIERRCKLLGLDRTKDNEPGAPPPPSLVIIERDRAVPAEPNGSADSNGVLPPGPGGSL